MGGLAAAAHWCVGRVAKLDPQRTAVTNASSAGAAPYLAQLWDLQVSGCPCITGISIACVLEYKAAALAAASSGTPYIPSLGGSVRGPPKALRATLHAMCRHTEEGTWLQGLKCTNPGVGAPGDPGLPQSVASQWREINTGQQQHRKWLGGKEYYRSSVTTRCGMGSRESRINCSTKQR